MSRMKGSNTTSLSSDIKLQDAEKEQEQPSPVSALEDPEKGDAPQNHLVDSSDWNGPNDPENPLNWPKWKRFYHIFPPALISFTG